MYRPDKWIDDDDAPTRKFVQTPSVAVVRPTPARRDGLWDANDVAERPQERGHPATAARRAAKSPSGSHVDRIGQKQSSVSGR